MTSRYRSVAEPLDIGGDFCDVVETGPDSCAFFIGDVCGHDLQTVSTMMIARHTLRALAIHETDPADMLVWLHDTLVGAAGTVYCSVVCGSIVRAGDRFTVSVANAGHPAPILHRSGRLEVVEPHGMLVNALDRFERPPVTTIELGRGDAVLLYTDGLLDSLRPRLSVERFVERLDAAIRRGGSFAEEVDAIIAEIESVDPASVDDLATLVLCPG